MVASIVVGLFIIHAGFSIIKENISVIIGEQVTDEDSLAKIRKLILSEEKIEKIDRLTILKFGYFYNLTCELTMDGNLSLLEAHKVVDDIENNIKIMDEKYEYITIHINPL